MFVFNGSEYPLDMDSLAVNERINKAVRKMQRAMKSAEGKPPSKYQQHVVAALKAWCNETFADDSAGNAGDDAGFDVELRKTGDKPEKYVYNALD